MLCSVSKLKRGPLTFKRDARRFLGKVVRGDGEIIGKEHSNYQFVDQLRLEVKGGKGGNGCVSFEMTGPGRKRPSGGSGGRGGHVFLVADQRLVSLKMDRFHFEGGAGRNGAGKQIKGRGGDDVFIRVPIGTKVRFEDPFPSVFDSFDGEEADGEDDDLEMEDGYDSEDAEEEEGDKDDVDNYLSKSPQEPTHTILSDAEIETLLKEARNKERMLREQEEDSRFEVDAGALRGRGREASEGEEEEEQGMDAGMSITLNADKELLLVARGGAGGIGNAVLTGSVHAHRRMKLPGQQGEEKVLQLEVQVIADVGLVGYPNAGKSSLLRALSNAMPKVAPYAFTTLYPSVGIVQFSDHFKLSIADIPGLIDGAHVNRGLGHDFLRHLQRTQVLLYVLDVSLEGMRNGTTQERDKSLTTRRKSDAPSAATALRALRSELALFDISLLQRPALILANKCDLLLEDSDLDHQAQHQSLQMGQQDKQREHWTPDATVDVEVDVELVDDANDDEELRRLKHQLREEVHEEARKIQRTAVEEAQEAQAQRQELRRQQQLQLRELQSVARELNMPMIVGSAETGVNMGQLAAALRRTLQQHIQQKQQQQERQ